MLDNYTRVQLLTDRFRQEGAVQGNIGYVIEVYDNGDCEVEFSNGSGTSYAQIVATQDELKVAEPSRFNENGSVTTTVENTFVSTSAPDKPKTKVVPFKTR